MDTLGGLAIGVSAIQSRKLTSDELTARRGANHARPPKLNFLVSESASYAAPSDGCSPVAVPARRFLALDSVENPRESPEYQADLAALYASAYGVKLANKRRAGSGDDIDPRRTDFGVAPLERIRHLVGADAASTRWTLLQRIPDWIDDDEVAAALASVELAKGVRLLGRVRVLELPAARYAQTRLEGARFDVDRHPAAIGAAAERFAAAGFIDVLGGPWHEVCLADPAGPSATSTYLIRIAI